MKKIIRRLFNSVWLAMLALFMMAGSVFAATSYDITVTAVPNYIAISNPGVTTWTLNGITGSGVVDVDTLYYANPLGDTTTPSSTVASGECRFDLTNDSGPDIDLYVNCGSFTGGDATMTNSDDGTNGATTYGGHSWYAGLLYANKVIMKSSGSSVLYDECSASSVDWGAEIETRTNAWTGSGSSEATMTISAQAD